MQKSNWLGSAALAFCLLNSGLGYIGNVQTALSMIPFISSFNWPLIWLDGSVVALFYLLGNNWKELRMFFSKPLPDISAEEAIDIIKRYTAYGQGLDKGMADKIVLAQIMGLVKSGGLTCWATGTAGEKMYKKGDAVILDFSRGSNGNPRSVIGKENDRVAYASICLNKRQIFKIWPKKNYYFR